MDSKRISGAEVTQWLHNGLGAAGFESRLRPWLYAVTFRLLLGPMQLHIQWGRGSFLRAKWPRR